VNRIQSGIQGLDKIIGGGIPEKDIILLSGECGVGKSIFGMQFLTGSKDPGIYVSFEDEVERIADTAAGFGWDVKAMHKAYKLRVLRYDPFKLEDIIEVVESYIREIKAKRVVLDTLEALFAGLRNEAILRSELRRLFRWLKGKGVTAVITAELGDGTLTVHGMEEYVSDCVIALDHRVSEQISSRRMRVIKYRGSIHGTNEYPFLIDEDGISVLPVTSLGLQHGSSTQRIPTGIARLDAMLGGAGYYRGSSVLICGSAGTGKTSIAAHFADAACRRGERVVYFACEESSSQIMRNMRSIGIDLEPWVKKGLLRIQASRPTSTGLEMHLAQIRKAVNAFKPQIVIVDPLSSFIVGGNETEAYAMSIRLVDFLKTQQITGLFTSLTSSDDALERSEAGISSLIDTWLWVRDIGVAGERNRGLYVIKSRGMAHSNQIREFLLTDHGVELRDVYVGPAGVLAGSARLAQEAQEQAAKLTRRQEVERQQRELERKRKALEAQIASLRADFEAQETETLSIIAQEQAQETQLELDRKEMGASRKEDATAEHPKRRSK